MGLLDKLTGTKHPARGVVPGPAEEVRAVLLGLNRPDVPYLVRDGTADGADLVAEWRMTEPAWQTLFIESQLTRAVRIRMRLVQEVREVRAIEEQWEVPRVGNPPRLATSSQYSRGPDRTISRHWTIDRGESGRLEATETFRFDAAELRNPLRDAVLKSGWIWRGLVFGKL
ncbi:hypothetical protein C1I97_00500 [Streptomyces sp. NTH33]|uniref:hypothetical protein n=1 Tax=Streptomyces sp. NTH33 TaxID=1735453 RepID=UPI000DA9874E|nr:hypothetical protein [Streptomyces sp. NTH33]PZH21034.1 hypothetical protein C1I97_00500 [Streptomyces sp. NTH33]